MKVVPLAIDPKTGDWAKSDAEARKRGEQTGLDTPVVHAVNDAYLVGVV